ncbi:MAG: T9SS type A sorting domain-containing protein, partial [Bacteroidota bacterium]
SSSHPVNINYGAHSRLFTFTFDNINLPDSNVNEPASHGFIRYRIKPLSALVAGNQIKNNAAIYFDFNQPVLTDTALTSIVLPTGIEVFNLQSSIFNLSPNPADGLVSMNFLLKKNADVKVDVFNSFGQKIKTVLNEKLKSGKQQITFDAGGYSDGIYFVKMMVDGEMTVRKMVKM